MRAILAALVTAIEVAAISLAVWVILAIPCFLIWSVNFSLDAEPSVVFGISAGLWLLSFGVPLGAELPADLSIALGLPDAPLDVMVSLVPLGLTLPALWCIARATWRSASDGWTALASVLGAALTTGIVASFAVPMAQGLTAVSAISAVFIAVAWSVVAAIAGVLWRAIRDEHEWVDRGARFALRTLHRLGVPGAAALRQRAAEVVVGMGGMLLGLFALAGLLFALDLVVNYPNVIALSQRLHLDPAGDLLVFVIEIFYLPTFLVWTLSWLSGAGFGIGTGTSVTPFETLLGPLPALPAFGAIPSSWGSWGLLAPLLIVIVGVVIGALLARRSRLRRAGLPTVFLVIAVSSALTGAVFAVGAWAASGAIGPDRLLQVGPSIWASAGLTAAELLVGSLLGAWAARLDRNRLRTRMESLGDRVKQAPSSFVSRSSALAAQDARVESAVEAGAEVDVAEVADAEGEAPERANAEGANARDVRAAAVPETAAEGASEAEVDELVETYLWDANSEQPDDDRPLGRGTSPWRRWQR